LFYSTIISTQETFPARGGREPYKFEWKFSDSLTLTGQIAARTFDAPGRYYIELTVTDADGKQVRNTNLYTNVLQELPRVSGTAANTTEMP
jgi:PKD repeat protein